MQLAQSILFQKQKTFEKGIDILAQVQYTIIVPRENRKREKKMKKYFETPTQVMFWQDAEIMRENNVDYFVGIAYHDEIICACCGGIVEISEVENIETLPWVDITDAILS